MFMRLLLNTMRADPIGVGSRAAIRRLGRVVNATDEQLKDLEALRVRALADASRRKRSTAVVEASLLESLTDEAVDIDSVKKLLEEFTNTRSRLWVEDMSHAFSEFLRILTPEQRVLASDELARWLSILGLYESSSSAHELTEGVDTDHE